MQHPNIHGLILAGGKSTRMGTDKSFISYHQGIPQREFLFRLLKKYCTEVFTSCYPGQNIPLELNPLEDQFHTKGPMNGVMTAFHKSPDKAWLIVAVDMPYVNQSVIELLLQNRNKHKVATCFFNVEGKFPEPLITLWEAIAFALLKKFVDNGQSSLKDFLRTNDIQLIKPDDPRILQSINSKDQYLNFKTPQ